MPLYVPNQQPLVSGIKSLIELVNKFNKIPETDHIKRLFHLQKMNYLVNNIPMNQLLFNWLNTPGKKGWLEHLKAYSINPDASFFLKGVQFASAVVEHMAPGKSIKVTLGDEVWEYTLMQQRDNLLKNDTAEQVMEEYITISANLDSLAATNERLKTKVKKQTEILDAAKIKFDAIKGIITVKDFTTPSYKTNVLSAKGNNKNFTFQMGHSAETFIFRVEDRTKVGFDQELYSHPVSKYFIEDYGIFMNPFQEDGKDLEYRPVVLSQFANDGNLAEVAVDLSSLKDKHTIIASTCAIYFTQLSDFCTKLMEANAYHPDIKLTNFLVNSNLLRVSDRKTLITDKNPIAKVTFSTPAYSPPEWSSCLNEDQDGFIPKAFTAKMDMPKFMAYQVGIALKEFLILSQGILIHKDKNISWKLKDAEWPTSAFFKSPKNQIINLSLLIEELTRKDPNKRLSIEHIQKLLPSRNASPDQFYKEVEQLLPAASLGIDKELNEMTDLLNGNLNGPELITKANVLFIKQAQNPARDHRLTRMAEKLAIKCFHEHAESFFTETIEDEIHTPILDKDWDAAPWYRQVLHWISGGYFRVERVTSPFAAENDLRNTFKRKENQSYFPLLKFLPKAKLEKLGEQEDLGVFTYVVEGSLDELVPEYAIQPPPVKEPNPAPVVVSDTLPLTDADISSSVPASSMVVNNDQPNPVVAGRFSAAFFNSDTPMSPGNSGTPPPAPPRPVGTIAATLLQGDGSQGRPNQPAQKVSVAAIDWHNPVTGGAAPTPISRDESQPSIARP